MIQVYVFVLWLAGARAADEASPWRFPPWVLPTAKGFLPEDAKGEISDAFLYGTIALIG